MNDNPRDQLRASYTRAVSEQPLFTEVLSIMPTLAEQLLKQGRSEGLAIGTQRGTLIGRIQSLADILGRSVRSFEELSSRDEPELRQLAEELKAAVDLR